MEDAQFFQRKGNKSPVKSLLRRLSSTIKPLYRSIAKAREAILGLEEKKNGLVAKPFIYNSRATQE